MTIRLPSNTDNVTPEHVEQAINHARALFQKYEGKVDFNNPDATLDLYRNYQLAAEQAKMLAKHQQWMINEAERLP